MRRKVALAAAVLVGLLFAGHPRADAVDLTGTWQGSLTCKGPDRGVPVKFKCCDFIKITQIGDTVAIAEGGSHLYVGRVTELEKDPDKGAVTFIDCDTNPGLPAGSEMVFADVTTRPDGKGTLKGSGPYFEEPDAQFTCKRNFKRVSTEDPGILFCATP